jgi:hypothetical protein
MQKQERYSAHIKLRQNDQEITLYFTGLTSKEAATVHKVLEKNYSHITSSAELARFGWEVTE